MTRIVTILPDDFADWETSLLNGAARGFYRIETAYATAGGRAVASMGGLRVTPDLAIDQIDPATLDALVICGGNGWKSAGPPAISELVHRVHAAGKVVAAICDGTFGLARTGLLDQVAHTSNGAGYLDETGYGGKSLYRDVRTAVTDNRIVTAPGTAPVSFMAEVMRAIGASDEQLRYYLGLHAAQSAGMQQAA